MPDLKKLMPGQIRYTPPQFYQGEVDTFVWYRCWHPIEGKMKRKKIKLKRIKNKRDRRKHANEIIRKLNRELESGYNPWMEQESANAFATVDEVFDRYLLFKQRDCKTGGIRKDSLRTDTSFISVFRKWLHENHFDLVYIMELKRSHLLQYLDHMYLDREVSARTRNNHRDFLVKIGRWMVSQEYCKANPAEEIPKLREAPRRRQPISAVNKVRLHEFLQEHDPHYLRLCLAAYYCLIRRKELCFIKVKDVYLDRGYIYVGHEVAKNRKERSATIPKVFEKELRSLRLDGYPPNYYLFSADDFKPGPEMLNPKKITDVWTKYRRQIPLPPNNQFYSLRETGITDMVHKIDPHSVRDHADHHSLEITNGYVAPDMKRASEIIRNKVSGFTDPD